LIVPQFDVMGRDDRVADDAGALLELPGLPIDRVQQTEVVEDARAQLGRNTLNRDDRRLRFARQHHQFLPQAVAARVASVHFSRELFEIPLERCQ
jgi:hypothetical protein